MPRGVYNRKKHYRRGKVRISLGAAATEDGSVVWSKSSVRTMPLAAMKFEDIAKLVAQNAIIVYAE